jgi:hypothetical protein
MRIGLAALIAAVLLNGCASLEAQWRWHGISVQDQAAIRAALHKITNSPIVALQPYDPLAPNQLYFYTADDKIYGAEKTRGIWQISEAVLVY